MKITRKQVNDMSQEAFIAAFGPLFEHSPWVAERAAGSRPFAEIKDMMSALEQEVERSES
jgi:urate oxidase/2-oxo-4-hydroxy-4-carboxy-5-ureidoimidazoline decarboxylase